MKLWGYSKNVEEQDAAIILTSCDYKCLSLLLEPFMNNIRAAKGGDLTQYFVVLCYGLEALSVCKGSQDTYHHACLLLEIINPDPSHELKAADLSGGMAFSGPLYKLALLQKLACVEAFLMRFNVPVLWMDLDILVFKNPLSFLLSPVPAPDLITAAEDWDRKRFFHGDVCLRDIPRGGGKVSHEGLFNFLSHAMVPSPSNPCNLMSPNGGLWLVRPTEGGVALLETWLTRLYNYFVVKQNLWSASSNGLLDQDILLNVLLHSAEDTPYYQWDTQSNKFKLEGMLPYHALLSARVYHVSGQIMQSNCRGLCGGADLVHSFPHRIEGQTVVCGMPKRAENRMMTLHQNCIIHSLMKKHRNMKLLQNFIINESMWELSGFSIYPPY
ncbi:hypothetical protein CEUSTIGMA_g7587.t1 [Chlamydomonas eustigma]|uniref:Nucleotide-diphospho-sugar transferase domain-containing protein n=1 Tax=Chlamydomonas eustigma TaxID=1157962 RepID=A0A250XB83_9CHLO|nr:hypothetical protein CEUSTIGMA_g7587.t1 [Chlamydomonas eustigma]|eukprot:GAX80149.1 hypothetical protein CEUSTIGMA_g7587.t1 [Chlamydomonas eustigma]